MPQPFITPGWIKICGVRDAETVAAAAQVGATAIGLNFFGRSPRFVTAAEAQAIERSLGIPSLSRVGLFVNHSADEIETIAEQVRLSAVQLHGDESPEFVRQLRERHPDWKILKAFRVADTLRPVSDFLAECRRQQIPLEGCLLDARVEGHFGGTGVVGPWELIAREYNRAEWPPLILAGGLTPENVADAIRQVRPDGVDTASGVESSPGIKDTTLLARFVVEAQRAFAAM